MSTLLDPFIRIINKASDQVIDNEIPKKAADVITAFVNSGFEVVEDVVKIARDVTAEPDPGEGDP